MEITTVFLNFLDTTDLNSEVEIGSNEMNLSSRVFSSKKKIGHTFIQLTYCSKNEQYVFRFTNGSEEFTKTNASFILH